jgi:hypothetical protein
VAALRSALAALAGALVVMGAAWPGAAAPQGQPSPSVRAAGGVLVAYPEGWRAAVRGAGTVIAIAGPGQQGARPAVTILLARGAAPMDEMMASAARGVERGAAWRLLGEQRLSPSRWARYYVRGEGAASEYVMVGVARGGGWTATLVGVDPASDPELGVRAAIFQRILMGIVFPGAG